METVVFEAALFSFLKGGDCFLEVSGEIKTAAKHEDYTGRVFLGRVGLQGCGECVGGAIELFMGGEPGTEVDVVVGSGRGLKAGFDVVRRHAVWGGVKDWGRKECDGE